MNPQPQPHHLLRPSKGLVIAFLIIAAIGLLDASYLTTKHYLGGPLPCLTGGSCIAVTSSEYSSILGLPVALLGAIYYLSVLILTLAYFESGSSAPLKLAAQITIIGLLASLYFVSLQLFVIKAICIYCMISATTSTLLFLISLRLQRIFKIPA